MIFVTDTADNVVNVSGDRFYHVEKFQIKCKTVKFREKNYISADKMFLCKKIQIYRGENYKYHV